MTRTRIAVVLSTAMIAVGVIATLSDVVMQGARNWLSAIGLVGLGSGIAGLTVVALALGRRSIKWHRTRAKSDRLLLERSKRNSRSLSAIQSAQKATDSELRTVPGKTSRLLTDALERRHLETLKAVAILETKLNSLTEGLSGEASSQTQVAHLSSRLSVVLERLEAHEVETHRSLQFSNSRMEAVIRLCSALPLRRPLPPFGEWAFAPDMAFAVVDRILTHRPKNIVEAGSGLSTVLMGYALEMAGGGQLVAFEHDRHFHEATSRQVASHGLSGLVTVLFAPLRETHLGGERYLWYTFDEDNLPDEIDFLVVDGPPGSTNPLARYPALPVLAGKLSSTATIFVDDTNREDELEVIRRWRQEFGGLAYEKLDLEKGAVVLRRDF